MTVRARIVDEDASVKATVLDYANSNPLAVRLTDTNGDYVAGAGGGGGDGAIVDGVSASIKATVLDYAASNPLAVRLTDTAGDYVGAGAGTQYTEDAAAAANPTGTVPILVRTDTPAGLVSADGDNVAQRGTNYGAAYVQVVSSAGAFVDTFGGGTQYTEGDTDATITGTAMMMEGAANALVAAQGTAADGLLVNLGTNNDVSLNAGTNNIGDVDVLTVPADPFGVNADAASATGSISAKLRFIASTGIPVTGTVTVGSHAVTNAGTFAVQAAGDVAHDAVDSGSPVKVGAKAITSPKGVTLVANADRTDLIADLDGIQVVKIGTANGDLISERIADTGGTSTAFTNFSAVASTRNYVTSIHIYNSSATAGFVDFRDGAAGAVLFTAAAPAGGGMSIASAVPLFKTTANTALAYDVSGALSTVYINIAGYQSKS